MPGMPASDIYILGMPGHFKYSNKCPLYVEVKNMYSRWEWVMYIINRSVFFFLMAMVCSMYGNVVLMLCVFFNGNGL